MTFLKNTKKLSNAYAKIDDLSEVVSHQNLMLSKLEKQVNTLEKENHILSEKFHNLSKISAFNRTEKNIGYYKTYRKQLLVIVQKSKIDWNGRLKELVFEAYDIVDSTVSWYARLWVIVHYTDDDKAIDHFQIRDFEAKPRGRGYGSFVMAEFLDYMKDFEGLQVRGWLSSVDEVDKDNCCRRNHFYRKFGFKISGDKICLTL